MHPNGCHGRAWPIAFALLLISSTGAAAATAPARTVLALFSGRADHPGNARIAAAIRDALTGDDTPVRYFVEYVEEDGAAVDQVWEAAAASIADNYRDRRIDVVIAVSDRAMAFALAHRSRLFPDAPIVFTGLRVPAETARAVAPGITGVRLGNASIATLNLALGLQPGLRQVFVIANSSSDVSEAAVRAALHRASPATTLSFLAAPTVTDLIDAVKSVPRDSAILYVWHPEPEPGSLLSTDRIAKLVAAAAPVPVYGASEPYMGLGVVGGVMHVPADTGTRLGEMTRAILGGRRAQDLPVESAGVRSIVDWRQIRRWNLDPSRLPADTTILFRTPSAWEAYRLYIIAAVIVMWLQLLLIAGLLTQRAQRRHAEGVLRRREMALRRSYDRIRMLAGRLINAQEATRAQVARDLHDDVCQELVGMSMVVSSLKNGAGQLQDAPAQRALTLLHRHVVAIVESVRRLSHDLHPVALRLLGLTAALEAHAIEVEHRHDVQVTVKRTGELGQIDPDVALCLFRVAQEALRNAAVHGDARRMTVMLARPADLIQMIVADDGCGFDLDAVRKRGAGLGLVSMEERVRLVGGTLRIVTRPQQGAAVHVRVAAGAGGRIAANDVPQALAWQSSQPSGERV